MSDAPDLGDDAVRTPAEEAALSAFIDAAMSDADPGYPHGAAFIPLQDTPQTDHVLWGYLRAARTWAPDARCDVKPPKATIRILHAVKHVDL